MSNYKNLRAKLDAALLELETADSSDIDKLISLHRQSLETITALEKELDSAVKLANKKT